MSPKGFLVLVMLVGMGYGAYRLTRRAPSASIETTSEATGANPEGSKAVESGLPQARRASGRIERAPEGNFKEQFAHVDALIRAGNPREAYRVLADILAKDPKHERALEEMGMLFLTEFQDTEKAVEFFKRALAVNPANEFAVMELVGVSLQPEKAAQMIDYLKGLQEQNPSSPVLSDGLGELYLSQGRFSDAVAHLEKSAQDSKYAEFAYTRLASVYEQMGDSDKAGDYYRMAITHQSNELERRRTQGQSTDLLEADLARSQIDLAHLLVSKRKYEDAVELLNQAKRRLGNDWEVQALLDQIRNENGPG